MLFGVILVLIYTEPIGTILIISFFSEWLLEIVLSGDFVLEWAFDLKDYIFLFSSLADKLLLYNFWLSLSSSLLKIYLL
jgi:hypothetical protein